METKSNLTKNTLMLSIGTFMTKGLAFIMVPIFSSWLSTEDYGMFDLLCTYVSLLIPLIGLSSNEALFRFSMDVNTRDEKKEYVTNCLTIFVINYLVFLGIATISYWICGWEMIYPFCILLLGELCNMHLRGFLRAIKRLDIYSFANMISTIFIAIFTTLFLKICHWGLDGIVLGYGLGYIFGNIVIILWTKYWTYIEIKKFSCSGMKKLINYSYALIPNSIAWWLINVSDRTIISFFLGTGANGIYAIAYKIPNIMSALFGVFGVSWQQSATEAVNDKDRNAYYNKVYNKTLVILLSLGCGILSLNSWLFNYIFDKRYFDGYKYVPILIAATIFLTLSQFYGGIQISFKRPKENGITTVIGAIANIIIHLVLIRFIGLYAAAVSTLLSQVIVCVLRNIRLKKLVSLKVERETWKYGIIYLFFSMLAYYISNPIVNVLSVLIAIGVVIFGNRDILSKLANKVVRK